MVATVTASATAAATALANPAAMSFTFTDDFLPPVLIKLVAILLLLSVAAASCCFSKPPAEVARELGLLGLVKWLISSDDDDEMWPA